MARTKNYKKSHKSLKALQGHRKNVEKRGGKSTTFGLTLDYDFPANKKKSAKKAKSPKRKTTKRRAKKK